jgi:hypothetical protein
MHSSSEELVDLKRQFQVQIEQTFARRSQNAKRVFVYNGDWQSQARS